MLFFYKIFTFSQLTNKFYIKKFQNIQLTQTKIKIKTYTWYIYGRMSKKEWEIEGKRDRSEKREIRVDEDGDGQIGEVEQKGEEKLRKKREKRGRRWGGTIWTMGRRDLGRGGGTIWAGLGLAGRSELGVGMWVELRLVYGLELKWGWCVCEEWVILEGIWR